MMVMVIYIWVPGERFHGYTQAFADSYLRYDDGLSHKLVVAAKADSLPVDQPFSFGHWVAVGEGGWDLGPYIDLGRQGFAYDRVVLLGAYSRILTNDWLSKLCDAGPLASATGSWEETPHLRTSCLSAHPSILSSLQPVTTKEECWALEFGSDNLYQRCLRRHIRGVVVGRDGVYEEDDWQRSNTFRAGEQANLICADHRTDRYLSAGPDERRYLEDLAWGTR